MNLVHPFLGSVAVALFYWLTMLGFRGRHRKPYAPEARRRHALLGRVALTLVLVAALAGTLSTAFLRDDLRVAASWHFRFGWGVALLMGVQRWTSSRFPARPTLRPLHAGLGLLALASATVLAALGLQMLP